MTEEEKTKSEAEEIEQNNKEEEQEKSVEELLEEKEQERKINTAIDEIKSRFGKNSIVKASSLLPDSTAIERNKKIGGHHE